MPKTKQRTVLRCADHPDARAALQILVDPDAKEEHWVEAAHTLSRFPAVDAGKTAKQKKPQEPIQIEPPSAFDSDVDQEGCPTGWDPQVHLPRRNSQATGSSKLLAHQSKRSLAVCSFAIFLTVFCLLANLHSMWMHNAYSAYRSGEYKRAEQLLDAAIFVNPFDAYSYSLKGAVQIKQYHYAAAVRSATQALMIQPHRGGAYFVRAVAFHGLHDWNAALHDAELASGYSPRNGRNWRLLGDLQSYFHQFREAIRSYNLAKWNGQATPSTYRSSGYAHQFLWQYPQALSDFSEALAKFPQHNELLWERGRLYRELGSFDLARADFLALVRNGSLSDREPTIPTIMLEMAECSYNAGQYDDAVAEATSANIMQPGGAELLVRAQAYNKLDQPELAIKDLCDPKFPYAFYITERNLTLAEAYARLNNKEQADSYLSLARSSVQGTLNEDRVGYVRSFLSQKETGAKGNVDFKPYMALLQRQIHDLWYYSRSTHSMKTVTLFKVNSRGVASDITIKEPSGDASFDISAMNAIRSASPFAALPAGANSSVDIEFTFAENVINKQPK